MRPAGAVRYNALVIGRIAAAALLLVVSPACDEAAALFGHRDVGDGTRTLGVVVFSRSTAVDPRAAGGAADRFVVEAWFARYRASLEAETRAILGLGALESLPETGACALPATVRADGASRAGASSGGPAAELLDVGRIRVGTGDREHFLSVRTFPDLLGLVGGVTYGGVSALPYRPGRRYVVRGESDRAPWVSAVAPPDWSGLRLNGQAVADGLAGALDGGGFALRWPAPAERSSEVVVTLTWTGASGGIDGVICRAADVGEFDLPAEVAARLPAAPEVAGLTLRVERLSRVSFGMDRVDEALAVFRVSVTAPVR